MKTKTSLILTALLCLCTSAHAAFTGISQNTALPGESITLTGSSFNTSANLTLRLDETEITPSSVTSTEITFVVPGNATTGGIFYKEDDGEFSDTGLSLRIDRAISGVFSPPAGVSLAGYEISGTDGSVAVNSVDGTFDIVVPLDRALLITAFRSSSDPIFLCVALPRDASLTIDSLSTARAMAFVNPVLATREDPEATETIDLLNTLTQLAPLATLIEDIAVDGRDYFNDARFDEALIELLEAALQPPAQQLSAAPLPPTSYTNALNPDYAITPVRLETSIQNPDKSETGEFIVSVDSIARNPLSWIIEIYELNANQFPAGRDSVGTLSSSSTPSYFDDFPVASGVISAKLDGSKADLPKRAAKFITELIFAEEEKVLKPNQFAFEGDTDGVYVAQAYSGNLFYGTGFFLTTQNQVNLLNAVDKNDQWTAALAANVTIAVIDLASVFVDFSSFAPEGTKLITSLYVDAFKAMVIYRSSPQGITEQQIYDLIKTLTTSLVKKLVSKAAEKGITGALAFLGEAAAKTAAKSINLFGKVSKAEQALERGVGILTPDALAIERTAFVLGNPFEPRITDFGPRAGRAGDFVTVSGYNFPASTSDIEVSFCQFTSSVDPEDPDPDVIPANTKLVVEVKAMTPTSLSFFVPENWTEVITGDNAFICVETTDGKRSTTRRLPDGKQEFTYLHPPELLEVIPNPTKRSGLLTIHGNNFDVMSPQSHEVYFDDNTIGIHAANASPTNLTVAVPESLTVGTHTVKVTIGGVTTAPISFEVEDPVNDDSGFSGGLTINITKLDYSNAADGEISFLEALLLARGELGRPVEQHLDCETSNPTLPEDCPLVPRETDKVSGDDTDGFGGGAMKRDMVVVSEDFRGQVLMLTSAILPFLQGDTFDFNGLVLDGSSLPANSTGFEFSGTSEVTIKDVVLRNMPGHGIHFINGANNITLENVRIESSGGDGIFFDGNAFQNNLMSMEVSTAGDNALHLSGSEVTRNVIDVPSVSTTTILGLLEKAVNYGILVESGAHHNFINPGTVRDNNAGGALIRDAASDANIIGSPSFVVPRYTTFYRNGGPGIHLMNGVEFTTIRHVNPAGNDGAGILIEGPDSAFNRADSIHTGVDYLSTPGTADPQPNEGAGIHLRNGTHHNIIGGLIPGGFGERSSILNNAGSGVLIEDPGTSFNIVNRAHLGYDDPVSGIWTGAPRFLPNGEHGIHIRNGASSNILGAFHSFLDLHIHGQPEGAGILVEGEGTDNNEIFGNQIGVDHGFIITGTDSRLAVGIHIKDGPTGTLIGKPGNFLSFAGPAPNFLTYVVRTYNEVAGCDIGILLDNCGDTSLNPNALANRIQNNYIGVGAFGETIPNDVGIAIRNGAGRNYVGGFKKSLGNQIGHNVMAGIRIEDNVISDSTIEANLIMNNRIHDGGSTVIGGGITDPLASAPPGIGIHFKGSSTGNIAGVARQAENEIENNVVGAYFEGVTQNRLQGNLITGNSVAGVIIVGGSDNSIGDTGIIAGGLNGANVIVGNGSGAAEQGGVIIANSSSNKVLSNLVGLKDQNDNQSGNKGSGILIKGGGSNRIGGGSKSLGNLIGNNQSHGIEITAASSGNMLNHNIIGGSLLKKFENQGSGVHLSGGANGNKIGGEAPTLFALSIVKAGNTIAWNKADGISLDGSATLGNSILDNSIFGNTGEGINLLNDANENTPPRQPQSMERPESLEMCPA